MADRRNPPADGPPSAPTKSRSPSGEHSVTPTTDPNSVPEALKETAPQTPIRGDAPPALNPDQGTLEAPLFTKVPRTWEPDPVMKSRAAGPVAAVELANFGAPPPEVTPQGLPPVDITPQGSQPIRDQEEIPTSENPAYLDARPLGDEPPPTVAIPPIGRTRTGERKAAEPPPTVALPPIGKSGEKKAARSSSSSANPLLSQKALQDEQDKAKRRDLHVTLLVGAIGALLIGIVYKVTMYEEPPSATNPFRPTVSESFRGNSGGGGKGAKGGGKAKERGGGDAKNPFKKVAETPAVAEACSARCSQRQQNCATTCGKSERCRDNCLSNLTRCEERCGISASGEDDHDASELDCWTPEGKPRRCTQSELRERDSRTAAALKALCRTSTGELMLCPKDAAKMQQAQKLADKECGPDGCAGRE